MFDSLIVFPYLYFHHILYRNLSYSFWILLVAEQQGLLTTKIMVFNKLPVNFKTIDWSVSRSVDQSISRSVGQTVIQSVGVVLLASQSVSQPIGSRPDRQSVSPSICQLVRQPVQFINWSVSLSVNQWKWSGRES